MSIFALAIVLVAAFLHALWNALLKAHRAQTSVFAAVVAGQAAVGLVAAPLLPLPHPESWPWLVASTVIHWGYLAFLYHAYRYGDLSHVYPVSRGVAPALVTLGGYTVAGEALPPIALVGVAVVSLGILLLATGLASTSARASAAALATGFCIACYSVVDGVGVRLAGVPWSYVAWLMLLEAPGPLLIWLRFDKRISPRSFAINFAGGVLSAAAYGLVLFAKTIAPIAAVSAVRESSVAMASLIGVLWLGDRPWKRRLIAALVVLSGVAMLAVSG